ncbi:MAG: hypothetical protein ACRDNF_16215 [Streptosporangiaceae bacterium]
MKYHTFGRRGRVAALATLIMLAAAGCASSAPSSQASGGATPAGTGGVVSPSPGPGSAGTVAPAAPGEADGFGARSGIEGGALFGGDLPLADVTSRLGRNLAIVRVYYRIGEQFRNPDFKSLLAGGNTTLLISLTSVPGKGPSYADIIAGKEDGAIRSFLQQVEQTAVTYHLGAIYLDFEVEANTPPKLQLGTPAQFVQAWDHVHQLATGMHLDWQQGGRIHWVLILTQIAYMSMSARPHWALVAGQANQYWPGANEVDIVAADGYNSGGCRGVTVQNYVASGDVVATPEELFDPLIQFAKANGNLPVFIPEWGSVAYASASEQPSFIAQMGAFVAANREIAAALYWDWQQPGKSCDYILNNEPQSMAELAAVGHSPALQGRVAPTS